MNLSITGIAFFAQSIAFMFLLSRFYQCWQKEKTIVSKLFLYFTGVITFDFLTTAIGSLFFYQNLQILKFLVIKATFLQGLVVALIGYTIFHIKLPKISPWAGFLIFFSFGIATTVLSIATPFAPFSEAGGAINWDIPPLAGLLRTMMFLLTLFPLIIILIQERKVSQTAESGIKITLFTYFFLLAAVSNAFDLYLEKGFNLPAFSSDIGIIILSVITFLITVFSGQKEKQEKEQ